MAKEYQLRVDAISSRLQECAKKLSDAFNSTGGEEVMTGDVHCILCFTLLFFADPRPILLQ